MLRTADEFDNHIVAVASDIRCVIQCEHDCDTQSGEQAMNCDHCHKVCTQTTHGPGVPENQYWCDDCCRSRSIRVLNVFVWDGDLNRQRWMEEQRIKTEARNAQRVAYFLEHGAWPKKEVA
jgi:hypothetical protein